MKLLYDESLSPRLALWLADAFPGSAHVDNLGLDSRDDLAVWEYTHEHGYHLVTKDADPDSGVLILY